MTPVYSYVIRMTTQPLITLNMHSVLLLISFLPEAEYGQKLRVIFNDKVSW